MQLDDLLQDCQAAFERDAEQHGDDDVNEDATRTTAVDAAFCFPHMYVLCFVVLDEDTMSRNTGSSCAHHPWSLLVTFVSLLGGAGSCTMTTVLATMCCCNTVFGGCRNDAPAVTTIMLFIPPLSCCGDFVAVV
jgi:hypothetical protein